MRQLDSDYHIESKISKHLVKPEWSKLIKMAKFETAESPASLWITLTTTVAPAFECSTPKLVKLLNLKTSHGWIKCSTTISLSDLLSQEVPINWSHEPIPVDNQALISNNKELDNENAIKGVTYDLDHVPTEHEAWEEEDSDETNIKSVETETSVSSQDQLKFRSGRTIKRPARHNNAEFETNLMNYCILLDNDKECRIPALDLHSRSSNWRQIWSLITQANLLQQSTKKQWWVQIKTSGLSQ